MRAETSVAVTALFTCAWACAQPTVVNSAEKLGPEPRSATWSFPLRVDHAPTRLCLDADVKLTAGTLSLRLKDPKGAIVRDESTKGELKLHAPLAVESTGVYQLDVIADQALGNWTVRLYPLETASASSRILISGDPGRHRWVALLAQPVADALGLVLGWGRGLVSRGRDEVCLGLRAQQANPARS
jgi:hypothetical protein